MVCQWMYINRVDQICSLLSNFTEMYSELLQLLHVTNNSKQQPWMIPAMYFLSFFIFIFHITMTQLTYLKDSVNMQLIFTEMRGCCMKEIRIIYWNWCKWWLAIFGHTSGSDSNLCAELWWKQLCVNFNALYCINQRCSISF